MRPTQVRDSLHRLRLGVWITFFATCCGQADPGQTAAVDAPSSGETGRTTQVPPKARDEEGMASGVRATPAKGNLDAYASLPPNEAQVVKDFHLLFHGRRERTWQDTFFLGVNVFKNPSDMWVYQEILAEVRPDVIVECGTAAGGSALYMAHLCDAIGHGRVITIDIETAEEALHAIVAPAAGSRFRPSHPRITYMHGSTTSAETQQQVVSALHEGDTVMVILDSDHSAGHVLEEMRFYSQLVSQGSYLIVEDTNLSGHPVEAETNAGPMEARDAFFGENSDFVTDTRREKFFVTQNPKGYLLRVTERSHLPRIDALAQETTADPAQRSSLSP